ncbi:MAG TPA: diacylglycerol kinase family protein [Candidatus Acidoferrum sp.]|nr:diacylglycerol kinase family protein [Candidatus Acidoferrum sp.]
MEPSSSILRESVVTVFVNPRAGGGRAQRFLPQFRKIFESFQVHAQFVITDSAEELESAARSALSQGSRTLFAMGGDGTLQRLVNAAFGTDALLGILPMGGGNDFAAALGLPADPLKAGEILLRGVPRFVDLVRVCSAEGRARLYCGGGGIGLDAQAALHASGSFRLFPGRSRYIASALRALAGFVPIEVCVEFPGSDVPPAFAKVLLAAVLNTPTYGAGLKLAPRALLNDTLLHVVMIEDIGALGILRLLPRLAGSGELRTTRVKRWQVPRVRLTSTPPTAFHGDGEIFGLTPVDIEVVPRAAKILAPAES